MANLERTTDNREPDALPRSGMRCVNASRFVADFWAVHPLKADYNTLV
jgi:hypothetical protein